MALKDTVRELSELLEEITEDLAKAERGNKAASQRVRTGTVHLAKVAKVYRKESVRAERNSKKKKVVKKKAAKKKTGRKKTARRSR